MEQINKHAYRTWETDVIKTFYSERRRETELIPTDGNVAVLSKEKIIAVVCPDHGLIQKVAEPKTEGLPVVDQFELFHIGNNEPGNVKYGFDMGRQSFAHPAIDAGGLTQFKQTVGQPLPVAREVFIIKPDCDTRRPRQASSCPFGRTSVSGNSMIV